MRDTLLSSTCLDDALWSRRRFIKLLGAAALAPALTPLRALASSAPSISSVLIIGDSMALCGFGPHLDSKFRNILGVPVVNTYMACGTHPLSWTTLKAYAKAQSRCGYWSIESGPGGSPVTFKDTYGSGRRPMRHEVPKIESLLPAMRPDIMIVQLGNNLFDLLKGKAMSGNGAVLEPFIKPFLQKVAESGAPLRRIFWVAPPVCGSVPPKSQDILVQKLRDCAGPGMRVIDSRELIAYPYSGLQPDRQHFAGNDMVAWADRVYAIISEDLAAPAPGTAEPLVSSGTAEASGSGDPAEALIVECVLEKTGTPFRHEEIAPYKDSLVAFVYRVRRVLKGEFRGSRLVVLHAAHIAGKRQPMHAFASGQRRILRLLPVDQTPWATLKSKDDPRYLELDRFVCVEDNAKFAAHL